MATTGPEFVIRWNEEEQRFVPSDVHIEMRLRGVEAPVPMEIVNIRFAPPDRIKLEQDATSEATGVVLLLHAGISDSLLHDADFFEKIKEPVRAQITGRPLAEQTMSLVMAEGPELKVDCTIRVEPPPAKIHWQDEELGPLDDPEVEVEADGEDELKLLVRLERFQPLLGFVDEDDTVHFSHMTMEMYPPEIFGPHKDDLPRNVAKRGSGNRRNRSRWDSKTPLPSDTHPNIALPVKGYIRVRAWGPKDIADRIPDEIVTADGAHVIAEQMIPVNLVPVAVKAEMVEPIDPIPADGKPHDVVLEFTRKRTGAILRKGEVSWELEAVEGQPGGRIDPGRHTMVPEDNGRVTIHYTPPELTYEPGGNYRLNLRIFSGSGPNRRESEPVVLDLSPALHATIDGEKKGLDFDTPYDLVVAAGATPCLIVGHEGWHYEQSQVHVDERVNGNDVLPVVKVMTKTGERDVALQVHTNQDGLFEWKLPELERGLAHMPLSRQKLDLRPFEQAPPCFFDQHSKDVIIPYLGYQVEPTAHEVLWRLLTPQMDNELTRQRWVMAKNLTTQFQTEAEKAWHGTDLMLATMRGTVLVDGMHTKLVESALDTISKLFFDLLDKILKITDLGKKLVKAIPQLSAKPFIWASQAMAKALENIKWLLHNPAIPGGTGDVIGEIDDMIRMLSGAAPQIEQIVARVWGFLTDKMNRLIGLFIDASADCAAAALAGLQSSALYGAKKSADKLIKELAKALHGLLGGAANTAGGPNALKNWLKEQVPGLSLQTIARDVVPANARNVAAFSYPFDASSDETYINSIKDLGIAQDAFNTDMKWIDDFLKGFSLMCDALWVIGAVVGVILSLASYGLAAPLILEVLSTISTIKLTLNTMTHLTQGVILFGVASMILGGYESLTKSLTGIQVSTP